MPILGTMRTALAAGVLAALMMPGAGLSQSRAEPEASTEALAVAETVRAKREMIVTANPHASRAGLAMLEAGGSAADAAIAALLVLNVVEPQSSGLGGGAFALVHGPEGLTSWDARETAPAAATAELFLEDGTPMAWSAASETGRAVGVPGLPRLLEALHARHGQLDWPALFVPAIRLAGGGFPVSPRLAGLTASYQERLARTPARQMFLSDGAPLLEGAMLRQPELATTLTRLALGGADAFYEGPVAEAIVDAVSAGPHPGAMSAADLAGYRVIERAPVCHGYRALWQVCGMGPPSSGATTVGQMLGVLDQFAIDPFAPEDTRLWHLFAEASKLAYADRALYLADPDHVDVPVRGLLDPDYLALRSWRINGVRATVGAAEAGRPPEHEGRWAPGAARTSPGTTHLSVMDADGLTISLTASIETAFGSGRMAGGTLLNNQLTDFSFVAEAADGRAVANAPGPGKRPRSSMAPTIVYHRRTGAPSIVIGSPGGSRIPEYVAVALVRLLDLGQTPGEAVSAFHVSQRNRDSLVLEAARTPDALAAELDARGHAVELGEMTSGLSVVQLKPEGLLGAADPRREGLALGR